MNILIIAREKNQQKNINTWPKKLYFWSVNSVVPTVYLGMAAYIFTVYLSGTEELSPSRHRLPHKH